MLSRFPISESLFWVSKAKRRIYLKMQTLWYMGECVCEYKGESVRRRGKGTRNTDGFDVACAIAPESFLHTHRIARLNVFVILL